MRIRSQDNQVWTGCVANRFDALWSINPEATHLGLASLWPMANRSCGDSQMDGLRFGFALLQAIGYHTQGKSLSFDYGLIGRLAVG